MSPEEITSERILKEISRYVNKDVTYIDAMLEFAKRHDLEVDVLGEIIRRSPIIKSKIQDDAERLNMMEKTAKLPI